ncbi:hypothetical protein PGTUg99_034303 [Puccinia graminis f. sp. tritici]|uniref:Uncharacterized protein n=1 Tax=Puccinia graminis f. sp. tritici TaxID=56615 RepID=A0A5B0RVM1_PUCGR|nr:hypothetical protein PGTUg99_034303 [Puccinia graminis f. sp. tritici]
MAGLRRVRYVTLDASPSFGGRYATSSEGPCVKFGDLRRRDLVLSSVRDGLPQAHRNPDQRESREASQMAGQWVNAVSNDPIHHDVLDQIALRRG